MIEKSIEMIVVIANNKILTVIDADFNQDVFKRQLSVAQDKKPKDQGINAVIEAPIPTG
jgi:hypothetical protein